MLAGGQELTEVLTYHLLQTDSRIHLWTEANRF